jgi:hypothetical protein
MLYGLIVESESKPRREPIPQKVEEAASIVVDSALSVHRELGPGLLESAYEACLVDELRSRY